MDSPVHKDHGIYFLFSIQFVRHFLLTKLTYLLSRNLQGKNRIPTQLFLHLTQ